MEFDRIKWIKCTEWRLIPAERCATWLARVGGNQKKGGAWCDLHLPFFTQADRRRTRRDDLLSAPPVFLFQEFHKFQNWRSRKSAERNGSTSRALVRKWIELIELSRISAIISVRYAAVYANDVRWIFLKKSQNWNLRFVQFFWKSISAIGLRRQWPISAEWPYFLPTLWRWFSLETHTHTRSDLSSLSGGRNWIRRGVIVRNTKRRVRIHWFKSVNVHGISTVLISIDSSLNALQLVFWV